jgi:hypothetical protein
MILVLLRCELWFKYTSGLNFDTNKTDIGHGTSWAVEVLELAEEEVHRGLPHVAAPETFDSILTTSS